MRSSEMSSVIVSTYRPPWGDDKHRVNGPDEDILTMAVQAGRLALKGTDSSAVSSVVFVGNKLPLLPSGDSAVLLAALDLPANIQLIERAGTAVAALDAVATATAGTLVITAHEGNQAGGAAALVIDTGTVICESRIERSLPLRTWADDGSENVDEDPRLLRERGALASLSRLGLEEKVILIAGLDSRTAAKFCAPGAPEVNISGPASGIAAIAAAAGTAQSGLVGAWYDASAIAARIDAGAIEVRRFETPVLPAPRQKSSAADIKFAATAYERAFDSKLGLKAGKCRNCGTLAMPPRYRCLECGSEEPHDLTRLPRRGTVYTTTTIHTPVPGLATPYSLAMVEAEGTEVRMLLTVTGAPPATVKIGDTGSLVLRVVAKRSGVCDYGYAFQPDEVHAS